MTLSTLKVIHSAPSPIPPALARTLAALATIAAGLEPRASLPTVATGASGAGEGHAPSNPQEKKQEGRA